MSSSRLIREVPISLTDVVIYRPFLIDLDSANGTVVNDKAVPASRFYELRSGDGAFRSRFPLALYALADS